MIKQLRYLCTLLLMAVAGVAWGNGSITFADLNLENGVQYLDPFDGGDFTVTFAGGTNDGKYYTTGSGIRVYGGGTMTIAAKSGNITAITITYSGDSYKPTSSNVVNTGTYNPEDGTWSGESSSVVFTRPSGNGHWRVQKVEVTIESGTVVTKLDAVLTFNPTKLTLIAGQTQVVGFESETDGEITFSSTDENVATFDEGTKTITAVGEGTATIKAVSAETVNYYAGTASIMVTVDPVPQSEVELPYTESFANNKGSFTINNVSLAEGLTYVWSHDANNKYMKASSYKGGNLDAESWLISPVINATSATQGVKLTFSQCINKYFGTVEDEATLWVKEENGEWQKQTISYPEIESGKTWSSMTEQEVDLSAYAGKKFQIAFKYVGTSSSAGTWEIKGIKVEAQSNVPVADYATLPFEWEGGASADLLALDGVSANGLGSDYAESNAPYRVKLDTDEDYILVKTDSQPGKVTIGVKMLGGANTSTITVQESADGENYTDVQVLTISGSQNDIVNLETTNQFAADSRYVRLFFTRGSNVGVGPITITKPATEIVAEETLEIEASATSGEIAYSIAYPQAGVDLTAAADVDWISGVIVASDKVKFATTVNTGSERSGNITLTYGTLTKVVKVTQAAAPQMYTLTIGNPENVTITATYNVDQVINNGESAELENGTEVTFALTIPEGYALENVTVAGEEEGQAVELTENATTPGVYTFTMPAFNVTINATVAKIETTTYTLATSVTPGKRYIIVGVNENKYKAMGEQKSNNRAAVDISVSDGTATVPSTAGAYEFVIDGNATDGYTIYDESEESTGYLYAASSEKNWLKTQKENDVNGLWTITFGEGGVASLQASQSQNRNVMQYNSSSSLFACYASASQSPVYLYEKEVSGETKVGDVNKDGHVTIADVTALVNIILGKDNTEPYQYDHEAANVNRDEGITIADVEALVNKILEKKN